ncbi:MAG: glycoside hydrolase family 19 protein [Dysgonomonas sp.]
MKITEDQLKQIYPSSTKQNRDKYLPYLNKYMDEYEINNADRIAAFLAQIGHESGQLKYSEEIASGDAYEGRKDLGNIYPGDGKKYKGRGLIQITGRSNYQQISRAFGVDFISNPELLSNPEFAVKSACWWWYNRKLNTLADKPI